MNAPRSVLVIRTSAIGDVVMASGLIPLLREAWPHAHIAWLAEPGVSDLLQHNPRIDEVILWRKTAWLDLWRRRAYSKLVGEVRGLRTELRTRSFDLVLDLQGLLKSGVLAWLSGARERVGLASREGSARLMTRVVSPPDGDRRMSSEYRFLADALGLRRDRFRLDLVPGDAAEEGAGTLLSERGLSGRFVALAPFTTRPQKHWFEDRWIDLATRFRDLGTPAVVLGGPGDRESGQRIASAADNGVFNLAGQTPLSVSAALVDRADLLVGVDTGLTHMGIALETPTVALFGSTRPYLDAMGAPARILYEPLPCSPCKRNPTCGGRYDCMRAHSVEAVLRAARELVDP